MGVAVKCQYPQESQVKSFEIFEIKILTTLETYNILCRPSIEVKFKIKLYPLLRAFQRYVARHLHIGISILNF
jgi:hypothetical protein